jgi:membrane fusion protein, adhesin transport system
MLNISENRIGDRIDQKNYPSLNQSKTNKQIRIFTYWIYTVVVLFIVVLFLPWTQVVSGKGKVTALFPNQRPQTIQSPIPGRISNWLVNEGDTVEKGEIMLKVTEIKDEYFDPNIIQRLNEELKAKQNSVLAYRSKAEALHRQIEYLRENLRVKLIQNTQKIQADSNAFAASEIQKQLATIQYQRADTLLSEGVISKFEWEKRKQYMQEVLAKNIESRNKYRNTLTDIQALKAEYQEKISKAESDQFSAESSALDSEASVAKLQVKLNNVTIRQSYYELRAPQKGLVTRILKTGIGENIKEGESIIEIMPLDYQLAVEIFIRPVDLPLIQKGQHARIEFDGWPAIVFSGWPNTSFGTFGAEVFAIDNVLDESGRYRILLRKDEIDLEWPEPLRFGAGANGMLLLKDVPVWYEIWRQINGFPPEFYTGENSNKEEVKKSKPKVGYSK